MPGYGNIFNYTMNYKIKTGIKHIFRTSTLYKDEF